MFSFLKKKTKQSSSALIAGQEGLSLVTLGMTGEYPKLETFDFTPWKGAAENASLLAKKVKQFGLDKQPCNTALELGEYSILSVEMPDVPPDELRSAVRWQIKDLIDFHIDDAVIDVFDMPPSGASSQQNSTYVVVSRKADVNQLINRLQVAKVNLLAADIPELILRNISTRLLENEVGVAMVYLARDRGLLVIVRQSTLYFARPLNMGYQQLNQGAVEGGVENNPQFEQLVLEVQRSLDYYDRYFQQPPVAGLVLAPTEEPIIGLDSYLNQMLGISVRVLDIAEFMDCDPPLSSEEQAQYFLAVGAAMREETVAL